VSAGKVRTFIAEPSQQILLDGAVSQVIKNWKFPEEFTQKVKDQKFRVSFNFILKN
jgi:outer membrane biosynthesis protein TonB